MEPANHDGASPKTVVLVYELQKKAMRTDIYLQFLYCVTICVPIGMFCNVMKCCGYLIPIYHDLF